MPKKELSFEESIKKKSTTKTTTTGLVCMSFFYELNVLCFV